MTLKTHLLTKITHI